MRLRRSRLVTWIGAVKGKTQVAISCLVQTVEGGEEATFAYNPNHRQSERKTGYAESAGELSGLVRSCGKR